MDKLTATIARAGIVSAIAEKGADYVYPNWGQGCYYSVEGAPSCIVGVALSKIGDEYFKTVEAEETRQHEFDGDGLPVGCIRSIEMDSPARAALSAAQNAQDSGHSWGAALEEFDATLARYGG